ncbi:MAG TPA: polysaccharide deacetylase family protein [Pseudolabrys sp.]|nr:polysaccharide deacetylase family protein [Pseudolabrys sp.]
MTAAAVETSPRRWRPSLVIQASFLLHAVLLGVVGVDPPLWPWVVLILVLNHLALTALGLWPRSTWLGPNITRLPPEAAARGEIALTIDDGPDPAVTPAVLALLDQHRVKATFFCIGAAAERWPDLCRSIVERGHTIENHTQHHPLHFAFFGMRGFTREISSAQSTLSAIAGRRPRFFRAPAGLRNPLLDPVLAKLGVRLVAWTARGFDTRTSDAAVVSRRLLQHLKAGSILLLHDGNSARSAAGVPVILTVLPKVLEAAAAQSLRLVTLNEAIPDAS